MSNKPEPFTKLGDHNYSTWKPDCTAALMYKDCWDLVNGTLLPPADPDDLLEWRQKQHMASGIIWQSLEQPQKTMVQELLQDPVQMWNRLASLHQVESPVCTMCHT